MFNQEKSNAFSERLMATLNEGALCLMTSIGHRSGLFDVLAENPALTSEELARKAGLAERYVREWLGAMVTGRVVEHDPNTHRYSLPPEHAAWLTRAATPNNMAVFAQYIPLLGKVEDDILHCFQNGGGVPYERYGRFHEVMAEDSGQTVLSCLFSHILPLVPNLTDQLDSGIRVLDLGCGSGLALNHLAERFPNSDASGSTCARTPLTAPGTKRAEGGSRTFASKHET